jgi:hypothetical protein
MQVIASEFFMKRTTIVLPPNLKIQAERHAGQLGISLGELIRQSLTSRLSSLRQPRNSDPFLADTAVFSGPSPKDLAENHDRYLYGDQT